MSHWLDKCPRCLVDFPRRTGYQHMTSGHILAWCPNCHYVEEFRWSPEEKTDVLVDAYYESDRFYEDRLADYLEGGGVAGWAY